jgi:hypothetical protein
LIKIKNQYYLVFSIDFLFFKLIINLKNKNI